MTSAQRNLILSGIALTAMTMAFGVDYALFDEHQTLVGMGPHMATGFTAGLVTGRQCRAVRIGGITAD